MLPLALRQDSLLRRVACANRIKPPLFTTQCRCLFACSSRVSHPASVHCYNIRSIGKETRMFNPINWPVCDSVSTHSNFMPPAVTASSIGKVKLNDSSVRDRGGTVTRYGYCRQVGCGRPRASGWNCTGCSRPIAQTQDIIVLPFSPSLVCHASCCRSRKTSILKGI